MSSDLLKPLRRGVWRYLSDRDILVAALVTAFCLVGTLGMLYLVHLLRVIRLARRAPVRAGHRGVFLVFGRRLVDDRPEADFAGRLSRTRENARDGLADRVMLLGGMSGGAISEAEAGRRWLLVHDWPTGVPLELEQVSIDSLENLRHARELLRGGDGGPLPPVWLVTSRYHLARCLYLARRLGFDASPLGAEDTMPWTRRYLMRLALEAGYVMWIDTGLRWARFSGNRRMAARIT